MDGCGTSEAALGNRELSGPDRCELTFAQFQSFIRTRYGVKDQERGTAGTFLWFMEEVGELASALQKRPGEDQAASRELAGEFADVLGWLTTLANMTGVDLEAALHDRYLRDGGRDHKV